MIFYIINTIIKKNYIIYDHLQWTLSVSISDCLNCNDHDYDEIYGTY